MLNDLKIKRLKPRDELYRVADHSGLCLEIRPSGSKFWRYRYRFLTKAKMLTIGQYPEITLAYARLKTMEYREHLAKGVDPSTHQKNERLEAIKANNGTFRLVANEFMNSRKTQQSKEWEQRRSSYFEKDVYPLIGNKPVHEIDSIDIKNVLDSTMARIKKSGRGTGEVKGIFVRQIIGEVMEYAIITKRISIDPTYVLRGYIKQPEVTHARPLTESEKKELMSKLNTYGGSISTRNAIKAATYTWLRSIEIRRGKKEYINFEDKTWTIPAVSQADILAGKRNMKKNRMHVVPLSDQAIEIIKEQFSLYPDSEYIFAEESSLLLIYRPIYYAVRIIISTKLRRWYPDHFFHIALPRHLTIFNNLFLSIDLTFCLSKAWHPFLVELQYVLVDLKSLVGNLLYHRPHQYRQSQSAHPMEIEQLSLQ